MHNVLRQEDSIKVCLKNINKYVKYKMGFLCCFYIMLGENVDTDDFSNFMLNCVSTGNPEFYIG